jgi:hypothetical protein
VLCRLSYIPEMRPHGQVGAIGSVFEAVTRSLRPTSGGECRESNPDLALTGDNPRPSAPMGQGVVVGVVVLAVSFIPISAIARVESGRTRTCITSRSLCAC